jgi:tetratricopeptide (TPR) repeat protein
MTYGSSMGGYAALRFADAVGANAVLALSPQYTIDPAKVAFERRWTQDAGRIKWRPEIEGTLAMGPVPVVVYDPQNEDGKHLQLIRNDIRVHAIKLPFSGHPVMTVLAEAKLLKRVVLETLSGDLDVEGFQAEALVARRSSPHHLSILAQAQLPQRPRLALAIGEKALSLNPGSALAKVGLARIQSKQGLYDDALNLLRPLAEAPKGDVLLHVQFAEILAEAGQYPEAILYADKVLARVPDTAHLIAWKAHFHWLNGEAHEAIAMVRQAQVLDRLNPHFAVSIKAYEDALEEDAPSTQKRRVTPIKRLLHGLGLVRHDSPDAA